jgi:hypothetical protein
MATTSDHELLAAIVESAAIEYEQQQLKAEKGNSSRTFFSYSMNN